VPNNQQMMCSLDISKDKMAVKSFLSNIGSVVIDSSHWQKG
jgi:hypothetical protein